MVKGFAGLALVAVLWDACAARPQQNQKETASDPVTFARSYMARHKAIEPPVQAKFVGIVERLLGPRKGRGFSRGRKDRLVKLIVDHADLLAALKREERDTELQRETILYGFELNLRLVIHLPVFAEGESAEPLSKQIDLLVDKAVERIREQCPGLCTPAVAEKLRVLWLSYFQNIRENDTMPAVKYPFPAKEFSEALSSLREIRVPKEESVFTSASALSSNLLEAQIELQHLWRQAGLKNQFAGYDVKGGISEQEWARLRDLRERAHAEHWRIMERQFEKYNEAWREKVKRENERIQAQAIEPAPPPGPGFTQRHKLGLFVASNAALATVLLGAWIVLRNQSNRSTGD